MEEISRETKNAIFFYLQKKWPQYTPEKYIKEAVIEICSMISVDVKNFIENKP